MKRAITIIFVVFLIVLTPINGLASVYGAGSDEWQNSDLSMQTKAFLYYCKSNNVILEGSGLDVLTSFTTDTYYKICNQIGINPTNLEAEIKNYTSDNLGLRFLFTNTGITAMNRIFSQFLQNNDLSETQQDVDKTIYQGKRFTDSEGRSCSVYVLKISNPGSSSFMSASDLFAQQGTVYRFGNEDLHNMPDVYSTSTESPTFYVNDVPYSFSFANFREVSIPTYRYFYAHCSSFNPTLYRMNKSDVINYNCWLSFAIEPSGHLWFCAIKQDANNLDSFAYARLYDFTANEINKDVEDEDVKVVSPFIENNNYTTNNNQTVNFITINNEGDVNYYYDDDEPGTTPSEPQDPSDDPSWQPVDPVIPPNNPDQGDNTIIDLPNIDIPDLPSLDFSLGDLREKFPFSIPFDIIALLSVLDGEPQAPVIDAHIPFGTWFDWHFEADFSRFDDMAALIRSVEFIGFCIGLIYITVLLVKG